MSAFAHIYRPSEVYGPLRQGEILSDLTRFRVDPSSLAPTGVRVALHVSRPSEYSPHITATSTESTPAVLKVDYPFVVVVSQDCDLTQRGQPNAPDLVFPTVLLLEVTTAASLRGKVLKSETWNMVKSNREERHHFLQAVAKEQDTLGDGLPELGLDFKRYMGVPTDELYRLIEIGMVRRRCVLNSPYMEHLCSRFGNYLNRVALPEPHFSVPAETKSS